MMRICIIAEGSYPYVVGGVSGWIHSMIKTFPEYEFILLTIIANRGMSGKFAYELPENVTEVHELYMVVYQALYGDQAYWVRPEKMFFGKVTRDGRTFNRFTEIDK